MVAIAAAASVAFAFFSITAPPGSNYRFSAVFLIPIIWLVFALRRRIALHPLHFALFAIAMLLHNLGALGYYQRRFLRLNFDAYVHSYFGFVGGLIVYRLLRERVPALTPWQRRVGAFMFIMGAGAIHEIVEWATTLALGPEMGMLKPENEKHFDTQRDLFSNLVGVTVALLAYLSVVDSDRAEGRPDGEA